MVRAPLLLAIGLLAAAPAARAELATPLPPVVQQSLDAFSAAHKACRVWSDGCVVCRRLQETAFACSTPGIACQPTALACQEPKEEQKPTEATKPVPLPGPVKKDAR